MFTSSRRIEHRSNVADCINVNHGSCDNTIPSVLETPRGSCLNSYQLCVMQVTHVLLCVMGGGAATVLLDTVRTPTNDTTDMSETTAVRVNFTVHLHYWSSWPNVVNCINVNHKNDVNQTRKRGGPHYPVGPSKSVLRWAGIEPASFRSQV